MPTRAWAWRRMPSVTGVGATLGLVINGKNGSLVATTVVVANADTLSTTRSGPYLHILKAHKA